MRNGAGRGGALAGLPLVAVLALGSAILAGCSLLPGAGSDAEPTARSTPQTTIATVAATPSLAAPTDAPPAPSISISGFSRPIPSPTETAKGSAKGLAVAQTRIRGRASTASWDIAIPVFSGPAVANEANRRVRAAANDLIAQVRREAKDDRGVKRTLTGTGTVQTNDGRTVQVTIVFVDFLAGTARPASYVTTTVIDVRRARPVLLPQVIQNPADGLRFLGTEVTRVARRKGEHVDAEGLAPRVTNWANWQSSRAGLTFHFPEYQLGGAGLRSYTVPWSRARLVLSTYGKNLLAPA
jgi:predicted small secreted protein